MRKKVLERIALCVMALMLIGVGRDVKADSNYSVSNPHVLVYQIYGGKGESEVISHDYMMSGSKPQPTYSVIVP